jgi:hypothetical protein
MPPQEVARNLGISLPRSNAGCLCPNAFNIGFSVYHPKVVSTQNPGLILLFPKIRAAPCSTKLRLREIIFNLIRHNHMNNALFSLPMNWLTKQIQQEPVLFQGAVQAILALGMSFGLSLNVKPSWDHCSSIGGCLVLHNSAERNPRGQP